MSAPLRLVLAFVCLTAFAGALGPLAMRLREHGDGRMPATSPGRLLDVGGHRVHVVEAGTGSPLVLVHGFGASTFDYEEFVLARLAKSHRVIAVDLYGFGWSERNDAFAYDWTLWSDQLAGVLDALAIARASVMGHSMGGAVASVFAARHPARVDRLLLVGALYPQDPSEAPLVFKALRTPVVGELGLGLTADLSPPGSSDAYRARTRALGAIPGTRRAWLRYVRAPDKFTALAAAYPAIVAPTLVLHGTDDESVSFAAMQRSAPSIRAARIVPVPGGPHFLLRDAPDVVVREADAFLADGG